MDAYSSDWRTRSYTCACGWAGTANELGGELFDGVVELSCPKCCERVVTIAFPTDAETRRAAAAGDEEAKAMLADQAVQEKRVAEWEREALRGPAQLPDVDGDGPIALVWDLEPGEGEPYYVIRAGEQSVWRELARYEDWERFQTVKAILKAKYGARFLSVTPTAAAESNLIGDCYTANLDPN